MEQMQLHIGYESHHWSMRSNVGWNSCKISSFDYGILAKLRRSRFSIELEMLDRSSQQHSSWMLIRCISLVDIFLLRYHSFDTSSFVSSRSKVDIWTMIWELNWVVRYSGGFALAPEGDTNSVTFLEFERDLSSAKQFQWYRLECVDFSVTCTLRGKQAAVE